MYSTTFSRSLQSLLALAFTASATLASAGPACETVTPAASAGAAKAVHVSYADLDLSTAAGSHALYVRISDAARKVCAVSDIRDLDAVAQSASCERTAVSQAVRQVNSASLAALAPPAPPRG